ncbi:Multidrug export protein EmrB [Aquisphaera giovannonii]|uniref:Multidrug export protein EmrB n=1 Tax=Aquisphaera giovannonii TaxID=406548 RepID=A0A5B9W984_9BACT|nr:DHA2 family efflux MFS transporter permease subunit [Aquisphaera giovannonii]QEH36635.1 Multidrug export protein EmrB [Aquisphaera giovannonii]
MSTATKAVANTSPGRGVGFGRTTRAPINPWFVALTVTLATFMEVLDTSIANVALPHIAGGLSAGRSQATWVLTSYLVANAIVLPLSGFLIGLMGRKRFYMTCVLLFTISSALCGAAPSLELLIFFRLLQGIGGGGLQPSEQGILVDTFPAAQRGMAMAIYGVAVVVAPILGPLLGGYITDNYSWRWIFYINIPIGILSLVLTHFIVQDPPGMAKETRANLARGLNIDFIGLGLVSVGLGSLEVIYAKGQEWDFYNDPFWRAQAFMIAAAAGLTLFVMWELRHPNPIINLRLLGDRNFLASGLIIFISFAVLYGSNVNTPQMLQELFGYDAFRAGLVLSPSAFFTMAMMPIVGFLLGKKLDARVLLPIGLLLLAGSCYWQAHLNLYVSPWAVIAPRCLQMAGLGLLFVPLNNAAYLYISKDQTNNATGVFNMLRNEGGSLGIAIVTILLDRRSQFHHARLAEHIRPGREAVDRVVGSLAQVRMVRGGATAVDAHAQGWALMSGNVAEQARILAYLDAFWVFFLLALAAMPLILIMKKSVARGDLAAH